MKRIILITGGQSSGKSLHAEQRALELAPDPVYVATARTGDDEMAVRIERHRKRRGSQWTTIEEPVHLGRLDFPGRTLLVDCVTLWCSNIFFDLDCNPDDALDVVRREFDDLASRDATYIFVTNEIGLGGVAGTDIGRRFADLQGHINQYIAARADEVTLVVSGIPVKIK